MIGDEFLKEITIGCKHGKVDQKMLLYLGTVVVIVKRLKVVAIQCLN